MKNNFRPRRCLLIITVAACLAGRAQAEYVVPDIKHEQFGDVRIVMPITSSDSSTWTFRLHNVANGVKVITESGGTAHAKVVLYGGGVHLLTQPVDPKLKELIDAARAAGVQFNVCNFSLKGQNLDWHDLYGVQETDIVPSGFAEVGWLAAHGWGVDPAN